MIREWPPGKDRIKEGAPYKVTASGSIVVILSYSAEGEVRVGVVDPSPRADLGSAELSVAHGRGPVSAKGISAMIDPKWLELVEVHEDIADAWESGANE